MGLTCAKAARPQTSHEEDAAAQDRTDELLDRWRGGELARLQRVYRRHARPPQQLERHGFVAALQLEALPAAHIDALFDRFRTSGAISCRDFCATLSWWCRGDALERRAFLFCWFAGCADPEENEMSKHALGALCDTIDTPPPDCAKGVCTWRKFDVWAHTLSDDAVWRVLPLTIVSQPDDERRLVQERWAAGATGDAYHVLPRSWWDAWCAYVGWSSLQPPPPSHALPSASKHSGASSGPRPFDVDASPLEADRDGDLCADIDIACVPEDVWALFATWYGGGPLFPRRLQSDNTLDLYPVAVFVDTCDPNGRARNECEIRRGDRAETVGEFARRLSPYSRLYGTSKKGWRRLHSNKTCADALEAGGTYLLESQHDGAWPREVDVNDVSVDERPSILRGAVSSLRRAFSTTSEDSDDAPVERTLPATGLCNLGNTCFLNAAVQCLSHAPILRAYCLSDMYAKDVNRSRLGSQGQVIEAFAALLKQLHGTARTAKPVEFKKILGKHKPRFAGNSQQDAQEFLTELLDVLHEDVNLIQEKPYVAEPDDADEARDGLVQAALDALQRSKLRDASLVSDLFRGQLVAKKTCQVCGRRSVKFEPFTSLSLPVPAPASRTFVVALLRLAKHGATWLKVEAPRLGDVRDLKSAVARASGVAEDDLTLCDAARHRIYRVLHEDAMPLGALGDFPANADCGMRCLMAYERPAVDVARTAPTAFPDTIAQLEVGQRLDARDHKRQWYGAQVVDDDEPCRDANYGKAGFVRVRFDRFGAKWDECFSADDWPSKLRPLHSKAPPTKLETFEICLVHRTAKGLFGTPFVTRVAADRSCRALRRAVVRQAARFHGEAKPFSLSVVPRAHPHSLANNDSEILESGASVSSIDPLKSVIALDWTSLDGYREPLPVQKVAPVKEHTPETYDLASCLESFSKEETLSKEDSWRCPRCKKSVKATASIGLWSVPDVLVIHLKRFLCTSRWREKLRTDVSFPRRGLDLRAFLPPGAPGGTVYDLFAVTNHLGSLGGGHYTAHVKYAPCSQEGVENASISFGEDERWLHIDDDLVEAARPEDVCTDAAYVLFYRRRRLCGRLVVGSTALPSQESV